MTSWSLDVATATEAGARTEAAYHSVAHAASGMSAEKARHVLEGVGAAAGASAAAGGCAALVVTAPFAPLCGMVGAALGKLVGDLVDDIISGVAHGLLAQSCGLPSDATTAAVAAVSAPLDVALAVMLARVDAADFGATARDTPARHAWYLDYYVRQAMTLDGESAIPWSYCRGSGHAQWTSGPVRNPGGNPPWQVGLNQPGVARGVSKINDNESWRKMNARHLARLPGRIANALGRYAWHYREQLAGAPSSGELALRPGAFGAPPSAPVPQIDVGVARLMARTVVTPVVRSSASAPRVYARSAAVPTASGAAPPRATKSHTGAWIAAGAVALALAGGAAWLATRPRAA